MTFVAQPYERFVDDLLTGLTGGVIREEHLYTGPDDSYSLGAADAIEFSIRVFGQRNEAFTLFEPQKDYDFDSTGSSVRFRSKGQLPDEHSYFYVNYYRREVTSILTDRNPGSVVTLLAQAMAREWSVLHKQMEDIYKSGFVDLATGTSLDHVVALLGLTRKDAKFASGEVVFKRSTPAPGDITIPAGTLVSTAQGQNFSTTDRRTLRKGQLSVVVPLRAEAPGVGGKVDPLAITILNRPIFGIDSVSNAAATVFASGKETDEELRRRMQATLERAGGSTLDAIRFSLIEDVPELNAGNIQISENTAAPGLVELRFGLDSATSPELVNRIGQSIFSSRPAGIRVTHNLPTGGAAGGGSGITRSQAQADFAQSGLSAATHLAPEVLATLPNGILPLRAEVFVRLTQSNSSASQKAATEDSVRQAILDYICGLPMGGPLIYNKLMAAIMTVDGIQDAALLVGAEYRGKFVSLQNNLDTDNRKARIDNQHIFVGLMDEVIQLTIVLTVEARAGTTPAADALQAAVGQDSQTYRAIKAAVQQQLASGSNALLRSALQDAITPLLATQPVPLQFASASALAVSCLFVESGRVLKNTDAVTVAQNEVPQLTNLTVKLSSALDV
jgi:uncharacterized phage protein gp47/JayE